MNSKKYFNIISYFGIPFYLFGIYFLILFFLDHHNWELLNNFLILLGIGLTFSSLKDSTRKVSFITRQIFGNEILGILLVFFISALIVYMILFGLSVLFFSETYRSESIGVGMIVLGIGMIGYLKYIVERMRYLKSLSNH